MTTPASPLSLLKDPSLLKTDALINGQWLKGASRFDVFDPATGQKLADVANLGPAEAQTAIDAANAAWPAWRTKTAKERSIILRKWFDLLMANQDDLGRIMTAEQGKPLPEAKGEIAYGAHHGDSEAVALHAEAVEVTTENVVRANSNWLPYFDSRSLADTDFPVINPDRFGMQISIDTIGQDGGNRTISAQPADPSPIFVPLFMRASNWIEYPLVDVYRGSVVKDLALSQFDVARDRAWRTDALLASYVLYGGERDTKGRVQSVVSSWESTSYSYAKDGGLMRVENTRGGKSATAEFKDGRVRKITSADGGVTLFDYHEKSNLVGAPRGVQCANGLKLAHEYTEDGRLQTIAVGTARCVRLGYDAKGRVNEYALEPLADSPE